jgi:hypothetical protein
VLPRHLPFQPFDSATEAHLPSHSSTLNSSLPPSPPLPHSSNRALSHHERLRLHTLCLLSPQSVARHPVPTVAAPPHHLMPPCSLCHPRPRQLQPFVALHCMRETRMTSSCLPRAAHLLRSIIQRHEVSSTRPCLLQRRRYRRVAPPQGGGRHIGRCSRGVWAWALSHGVGAHRCRWHNRRPDLGFCGCYQWLHHWVRGPRVAEARSGPMESTVTLLLNPRAMASTHSHGAAAGGDAVFGVLIDGFPAFIPRISLFHYV